MFCKKCGTKLPDNAKFCSACGEETASPIKNNVAPTQSPSIEKDSNIEKTETPQISLETPEKASSSERKRKPSKSLFIVLLAVIFGIAILVALIAGSSNKDGNSTLGTSATDNGDGVSTTISLNSFVKFYNNAVIEGENLQSDVESLDEEATLYFTTSLGGLNPDGFTANTSENPEMSVLEQELTPKAIDHSIHIIVNNETGNVVGAVMRIDTDGYNSITFGTNDQGNNAFREMVNRQVSYMLYAINGADWTNVETQLEQLYNTESVTNNNNGMTLGKITGTDGFTYLICGYMSEDYFSALESANQGPGPLTSTESPTPSLSTTDVAIYVQGILDESFKGIFDSQFLDMIGITESEAQNTYQNCIEAEADDFISSLMDNMPTEEQRKELIELYKEIYQYTSYTVEAVSKIDEETTYNVTVVVQPIEIFHQLADELSNSQEIATLNEQYPSVMDDAQYYEYEMAWFQIVLDTLRELIPNLSYAEEQSIVIRVTQNLDSWAINEDDSNNLGDLIIGY